MMNEMTPMGGGYGSRTSTRNLRWLLVGLGAVLAVVLIAKGVLIIGGLIAVMVVVRTVMLAQWHHDTAAFRQAHGSSQQGR